MHEYTWQRSARALVAVGQPVVGLAVALRGGVLMSAARTALNAAAGDDPTKRTTPLTAADDWRWRGAMAGVLAIENGTAVLGRAGLDADARGALDQLLRERAAVDVAALPQGIETTLSAPMPNGSWLRLPALACDDRTLTIHATPLAGCEVIFDMLDGMPAFTEPRQLGGFVRTVRSPRTGQLVLLVVRADAALAALSGAAHGSWGER